MRTKSLKIALLGMSFFMLFLAYGSNIAEWVVPEKNKTMKNPQAKNEANINSGKVLYAKYCKSCHGKDGLGDGPKASSIETSCGDFSSAAFQGQTDGALYYKTAEGKGDMPGFKSKITDEKEIWNLVLYMRTLKK